MPRVDFKPDVDGFAFKNDWTFDAVEKQQIRDIAASALPIAAAALTPIVMAASPMIAPIAGLALGPVLPLVALAGPFLFAAAPKIAELIVNAVTDQIAKGDGKDNLCGGMTAAALDYHRLRWLPPRGNGWADNPEFDPDAPGSVESRLRRRIWDGQIESHLDNTPTVVLWKCVASVFGDWGRDWLRDRTREELAKIDAALSAGAPVTVGIVWKSDAIGHIVVGYALDWHGSDQCSVTVYDNERPGVETIFDIDLAATPIFVADRREPNRCCDGIFLGTSRPQLPAPAVVLSAPLGISPPGYIGRGEPLDAAFVIRNQGFGDVVDAAAGLRSSGVVLAPSMAWQLPMKPDPDFVPSAPTDPVPLLPDFSPIALGADAPAAIHASSLPAGSYLFEPVVMAGSAIAGVRVPRVLPNADGSAATRVAIVVNPRIPISILGTHTGFGCARPLVEGDRVVLAADLKSVLGRGIVSVQWTVTGALNQTSSAAQLVIAALPASPGVCSVRIVVVLADGTEAHGSMQLAGATAAMADRVEQLCELAHLLSRIPLIRSPLDVLVNPVRAREVAARTGLPDAHRIVADLQKALDRFGRT